MATHWLAKIFGWAQFVGVAANQYFNPSVHGWQGWLGSILSFAVALGIHAGASTDGMK